MSTTALVLAVPEQIRGLRRDEYDRLVALGVFGEERLELLDGMLVRMSPHDPAHADAIRWLDDALREALAPGWQVRVQVSLAVSDTSQPEPDLAVVRDQSYRHEHPRTAGLVVEVANTSHGVDLGRKPALYAAAAVPEYWVLDFPAAVVHVHTEPTGDGYRHVRQVATGRLESGVLTGAGLDVAALFAR